MFVIDRARGGTDAIPEETIDMAGTTGNIYSITISQVPSCTCPDSRKGNQCKHVVYVSPSPASELVCDWLSRFISGHAQRAQGT